MYIASSLDKSACAVLLSLRHRPLAIARRGVRRRARVFPQRRHHRRRDRPANARDRSEDQARATGGARHRVARRGRAQEDCAVRVAGDDRRRVLPGGGEGQSAQVDGCAGSRRRSTRCDVDPRLRRHGNQPHERRLSGHDVARDVFGAAHRERGRHRRRPRGRAGRRGPRHPGLSDPVERNRADGPAVSPPALFRRRTVDAQAEPRRHGADRRRLAGRAGRRRTTGRPFRVAVEKPGRRQVQRQAEKRFGEGTLGFFINYVPWMGFTGGPAGGRIVASLAQGKAAPVDFDIAPFGPDRI